MKVRASLSKGFFSFGNSFLYKMISRFFFLYQFLINLCSFTFVFKDWPLSKVRKLYKSKVVLNTLAWPLFQAYGRAKII